MKVKINKFRLILYVFVLFIFIGSSLETVQILEYENVLNPSFLEVVIYQMNDIHKIIFNFTFIILLLASVGNEEYVIKNLAINKLKEACTSILIFIVLILIANFVQQLINKEIINNCTNENFILRDLIFGITLLSIRYLTLIYLSKLVNIFTKRQYWGYLIIIIISILDFRLYDLSEKYKLIKICLPIEHSRVMINLNIETYFKSILYWLILMLTIFLLINKYERGKYNENVSIK